MKITVIDRDGYPLQTPWVLDATAGTKMMWFDKQDERCLFVDNRNEAFRPAGKKFADKEVPVSPCVQASFTDLPFPDNSFPLVVFDPPQIIRPNSTGNVTKYYGSLPHDWEPVLQRGFAECFRVLKEHGTLIFKWSEIEIPISRVLSLTEYKPLFGHRSGKQMNTHWVAFLK